MEFHLPGWFDVQPYQYIQNHCKDFRDALQLLVSLSLHSGETGESAKLNLRLSAGMGSGTLLLFDFSLGSTDWMAFSSATVHQWGIVASWAVGFQFTTGKWQRNFSPSATTQVLMINPPGRGETEWCSAITHLCGSLTVAVLQITVLWSTGIICGCFDGMHTNPTFPSVLCSRRSCETFNTCL